MLVHRYMKEIAKIVDDIKNYESQEALILCAEQLSSLNQKYPEHICSLGGEIFDRWANWSDAHKPTPFQLRFGKTPIKD